MAYSIEIKNFQDKTAKYTFYQSGEPSKEKTASGDVMKFVHDQQVYKPSSLEVELHITDTGISISSLNGQLLTLSNGAATVAENYFIFNVKKKGDYVTLKAYSADYFLTLDKFCQAFTAKKLVEGIINPTLEKCKTKNFENFRAIAGTSVSGNLQKFVKDEVYPYAVQYNESFYDFMVRMCNRNGEFLYLDAKNKLHIGLSGNVGTLPSIEDSNVEYENSYLETEECSCVDRDYLAGLGCELNTEEKCCSSYGVYAPEYLAKIGPEKYCSWSDYTCAFTEIFSVIHAIADERTIYDASITFLKTIVSHNSLYGYFVNDKDDKYEKTYPENTELFSTIVAPSGKDINDIYHDIDNYQKQAQSNQVRLFFSANPNVCIADEVTYKNAKYVVYEIHNNTYKDNKEYKNEYEVLLVGETEDGFYPLPVEENRTRKASAQRAIVIDNFDPERLGRVRVMYPWQIKKEDINYWEEIYKENGKEQNEIDELKKDKVHEDEIKEKYRNEITNRKNATPWIRVSVPMASDGAGFLFTPAVDDEVLIDYEDGNIERPYVSGAFYNANNKPSIPAQSQNYDKVRSITSPNGHHISFTDNGGAERFYFDNLPIIKMANAFGVHDDILSDDKFLGGGFEISDYYGVYAIKGSTHGRSIDISSPFGTVSIDSLTGISINAPLGDVKIVGKNVSIEARNNLTIESGTNVKGYLDGTNTKNCLQKLYTHYLEDVANDIIDLSHYRHILEMFLRPIGGTMLVKSNRYMCFEAGKGETLIERTRATNKGKWQTVKNYFLGENDMSAQQVLINSNANVRSAIEDYKSMCNCWEEMRFIISSNNDQQLVKQAKNLIKTTGIISEAELNKNKASLSEYNQELLFTIWTQLQVVEILYKSIEKHKLRDKTLKNMVSRFRDNVKDRVKNWTSDYTSAATTISENEIIYKELKAVVESEKNIKDKIKMSEWHNTLLISDAVVKKEDVKMSTAEKITSVISNSAKRIIGINTLSQIDDERVWSSNESGAILLSDKENQCLKLREDGSGFVVSKAFDYKKCIEDLYNNRAQKQEQLQE